MMLQPRIRPVCHQCRSLLSSVRRSYATTIEDPIRASSATQDAISFSPAAAPMRKEAGFQLKTYKPRTPGVRHLKRPINDHLYKGKPYAKLTFAKVGHGKGGRNNSGRVVMRHRGGGARRRVRTVDFKRQAPGKHTVERIEYDPNRSAHLALIESVKTKTKSYIIASEGMRAGDVIESFLSGIPKDLLDSMGGVMDPGMLAAKTAFRGNCLPMHMVPMGTQVYCVGSAPGRGAVFCRSAGTYATVIAKDEVGGEGKKKVKDVTVRLQSGEVRKVAKDACATIGVASNPHWQFRQLGKAGRSRWLNIRPTVRGVAMNSVDHAHGGGRGKSKGNVDPVSIWGTPVCCSDLIFTDWSQTLIFLNRPNQVTRQGRRETRTNTLSRSGFATRASVSATTRARTQPTSRHLYRHCTLRFHVYHQLKPILLSDLCRAFLEGPIDHRGP